MRFLPSQRRRRPASQQTFRATCSSRRLLIDKASANLRLGAVPSRADFPAGELLRGELVDCGAVVLADIVGNRLPAFEQVREIVMRLWGRHGRIPSLM